MKKTVERFNWVDGHRKERRLSRSFDTLEEAERFSTNKDVTDIYRYRGRYRVEWIKVIKLD